MKKVTIFLLLIVMSLSIHAADYDYVDPGDTYYINNWGENDYVVVVRKVGNGRVKVRDIYSGESKVVYASELLTKAQLDIEESVNTATGIAAGLGILYCLSNPDNC